MKPTLDAFLPLQRMAPVFESRDVDEVRAYLGDTHEGFDVAGGHTERFYMRIHARRLKHMTVCFIRTGAPVRVTMCAPRRDYSLMLPLHKPVRATIGHDEIVCDDQSAVIGSPSVPEFIGTDGNNDRAWVSFDTTILMRTAGTLLGRPVTEPVVFAPTMDMTSDPAQALVRVMSFGIDELVRNDAAFAEPLLQAQFEQLIVSALLLYHPNTHSAKLAELHRPISPRDVRRVEDYIRAHFDWPLSFEDLVAVSGVPGRTLHQHFQDFKGVSPMAFLRHVRLDAARELLLRREEPRITDVALRCGFGHLGRFSIEYRKRFGESPSETALRARRG